MTEQHACKLANGFSTGEKVFAQVTFNAFWITGFIAIWQDSVYWALAYMLIVVYGIFGVVMRHLACPRCPHLHKFGDCLQAPPALTRWLVKKPTTAPMSAGQKLTFLVVMLGIPLFPQFWLWDKPYFLAVYWVFCGAWYAGQLFHFCRRCRVPSCPFNQAGARA